MTMSLSQSQLTLGDMSALVKLIQGLQSMIIPSSSIVKQKIRGKYKINSSYLCIGDISVGRPFDCAPTEINLYRNACLRQV